MLDRIIVAAAALVLAGAAQAQDAAEAVYVNVDGAAIVTTIALAAEACGIDEAAVRAAASDGLGAGGEAVTDDLAMTTTEGAASDGDGTASTEAPATGGDVAMAQGAEDPSTTQPASSDPDLLGLAVCELDAQTAADFGIPTTAEIVTE